MLSYPYPSFILNPPIKKIFIKNNKTTDEQWEKDLEAELQDFEVVNDGDNKASSNTDWEKDVDDLLGDVDDLK